MTDPFLQLVAQDLRRRKVDFAHTTVVFPNKRAALFFIEHLAVDEKAVWAPRFCTIGELFRPFRRSRRQILLKQSAVCIAFMRTWRRRVSL